MLLTHKSITDNVIVVAVRVEITSQALEEVTSMREPIYSRIQHVIERLANWPDVSGAKPLRGKLAGHYRVRTGDYRVQFHVSADVLIVEKIGHRDGFYED